MWCEAFVSHCKNSEPVAFKTRRNSFKRVRRNSIYSSHDFHWSLNSNFVVRSRVKSECIFCVKNGGST